MAFSLSNLILQTQALRTVEEVAKTLWQIRREVVAQELKYDTPRGMGSRCYECSRECIVDLARKRPELSLYILDHNRFSFAIGNPIFELRFCRADNDTLPKKRFKKVGLDPNLNLFDDLLKEFSDDLEEINSTHIYLVFKSTAKGEFYGVSLNAYSSEGELIEQIDLNYLFDNKVGPILMDLNAERKEAKEINSAAEELGLKGSNDDLTANDSEGN